MPKLAHIYFSGRVQGVGFRMTAQSHASKIGLSGWVKNLPDGRVEVKAEGSQEQIDEFLKRIEGSFGNYISDKNVSTRESEGEFEDFRIAY